MELPYLPVPSLTGNTPHEFVRFFVQFVISFFQPPEILGKGHMMKNYLMGYECTCKGDSIYFFTSSNLPCSAHHFMKITDTAPFIEYFTVR